MTADELLTAARQAGIALEARGDRLHVEAPAGALTPELRAELVRHKPDLLVRLAPVTEFVPLHGGLTVPVPALQLALDLERRGFAMALDADQQFTIQATPDLTDEDRAGIRRWRLHLGAILSYDADSQKRTQ